MEDDDTLANCPECGADVSFEDTTTSIKSRWTYTGTLLAILTVPSLPLVVLLAGLGIVSLGVISQGWWIAYTTVVLMAATWTFGKETLEIVYKIRGK